MKSFQGLLLVASPKLLDRNFYHSVILMVRHNEEGALGLILNRPLETTIQAVWSQVSESPCISEASLHQGGPCDGPLMVLHRDPALSEMEVIPDVHFTTEKVAIEQLVGELGDQPKFFVGYAGWGAGQLENELEEGSWLMTPATIDAVFDKEDSWERLSRKIHMATAFPWLDPKLIPDDPSVN